MFYQWGRKDPFIFPTSSEKWGADHERGKHPVKVYNIDGVLIYQVDNGGNNKDKQPTGGVVYLSTVATSMMETIKTPITFYVSTVITQSGNTGALWDYYWTSHSRGTDGRFTPTTQNWHNNYLDRYTSQLSKSIYDPCPFGFKISSNGTYNNSIVKSGWMWGSYAGGITLSLGSISTWFLGLGYRNNSVYHDTGAWLWYSSSTINDSLFRYATISSSGGPIVSNHNERNLSFGMSVRCIEELGSSVRPDRRTRSIWKRRFLYQ